VGKLVISYSRIIKFEALLRNLSHSVGHFLWGRGRRGEKGGGGGGVNCIKKKKETIDSINRGPMTTTSAFKNTRYLGKKLTGCTKFLFEARVRTVINITCFSPHNRRFQEVKIFLKSLPT